MSTPNLEELAALEAAATPAPWHQGPYYKCDVHSPHQRRDRDYVVRGSSVLGCDVRDAEVIVAARNALPWLIERAKQAERYEGALREIADYFASGGSCTEFVRDAASKALEGK